MGFGFIKVSIVVWYTESLYECIVVIVIVVLRRLSLHCWSCRPNRITYTVKSDCCSWKKRFYYYCHQYIVVVVTDILIMCSIHFVVVVTVLLILLSIHCCTINSFTKAYSVFNALFNCGFIKYISVDHHWMRGRTKLGAQVITINPKRVRTGRGVTYTLITRLLLLSAHAGGITPLFRPTSSPPDPLFSCSCRGLGWGMGRF